MKNKKMNEEEKIRKILDEDYFHVCYVYGNDGKKTWRIYFKNMPDEEYFSTKNSVILFSEMHTIDDVYSLKERFEKEKERVLIQHVSEYINRSVEIFSFGNYFIFEMHKTFAWIEFAMIAATILSVCLKNIGGGLMEILAFIDLAIIEIITDRIMTKYLNEQIKKHKEEFIKQKIYEDGLDFVNKILPERNWK